MSNNLSDLSDALYTQLGRLVDEDLTGDDLDEEIKRSKSVSDITKNIIDTGRLVLDAKKYNDDKWDANAKLPPMLEDSTDD